MTPIEQRVIDRIERSEWWKRWGHRLIAKPDKPPHDKRVAIELLLRFLEAEAEKKEAA